MPNWCYNELVVTGEPDEVQKFVDFSRTENYILDFNKAIPYPEQYKKLDAEYRRLEAEGVSWDKLPKDGYNSGGYEWCIVNWGTKWNSVETNVDVGNGQAWFTFDTAWSPSIPVTAKFSEMFPNLTFDHHYEESGMDFSGYMIYKGGKCVESEDGEFEAFADPDHIAELKELEGEDNETK